MAFADDALRDMDTDRPNVTNTPHTIDAGHLQIETGVIDYTHAGAATDALTLGHVNVRLGLLDTLEANVAIDSYDLLWTPATRQSGLGDLVVGGKLNLWGDQGGGDPGSTALAIQPQLKLPTAEGALGNGHPEYSVGVPFLVDLIADFHLGLQTVVGRERNQANTGYVTGWRNSASLDRVLVAQLDVYLEYECHLTTERGVAPQQTVDLGVTYPASDNLVLDTGVNLGLNRAAPAIEWLAGVSIRF